MVSLFRGAGCGRDVAEYLVVRGLLRDALRTALSVAKESSDDLSSKSSMAVD